MVTQMMFYSIQGMLGPGLRERFEYIGLKVRISKHTLEISQPPVPAFEGDFFDFESDAEMLLQQLSKLIMVLRKFKDSVVSTMP